MELTEGQKLFPASLLLGVTFVITVSRLHGVNMQAHVCLCMLTRTRDDIDFDQSVRWCVGVTARERAHNLQTFWPLAQMRTIKNRPWDNEPG